MLRIIDSPNATKLAVTPGRKVTRSTTALESDRSGPSDFASTSLLFFWFISKVIVTISKSLFPRVLERHGDIAEQGSYARRTNAMLNLIIKTRSYIEVLSLLMLFDTKFGSTSRLLACCE